MQTRFSVCSLVNFNVLITNFKGIFVFVCNFRNYYVCGFVKLFGGSKIFITGYFTVEVQPLTKVCLIKRKFVCAFFCFGYRNRQIISFNKSGQLSNKLRNTDFGSVVTADIASFACAECVVGFISAKVIYFAIHSRSEKLEIGIPYPVGRCVSYKLQTRFSVCSLVNFNVLITNFKGIFVFVCNFRNYYVCGFVKLFGGSKIFITGYFTVEVQPLTKVCLIKRKFVCAFFCFGYRNRQIILSGGSIDSHFKLFGVGCFTTFDGGNEFYGLCFFLKFNNEFVVSDGNAGILFVKSPRNNNVGISRALERKVIASVVTDKAHESESALFESNCVCIGKHRQLKIGKRSAADRSQIERSVIE